MKNEIIHVKYVKQIQEQLLKLIISNFWCLCKNNCSWKYFWRQSIVGTFKDICIVAVCYWYVKDLSTYFWKKSIPENILLAGSFHLNSKVISKSSCSLQGRKSFKQYQSASCFGMQTSPDFLWFNFLRN